MTQLNRKRKSPPRLAEWIIKRMSWAEDRDDILDNLREEYKTLFIKQGKVFARCWYWGHTLRSSLPFFVSDFKWRFIMLKNYLKIAVRSFKKHKGYSLINIAGLSIGIACSILVMLYVFNEISYDKFHEKANRIYRVAVSADIADMDWRQVYTPAILSPTLVNDFPEVENVTKLYNMRDQLITYKNHTFQDNKTLAAEPSFFDIFTFPMISGDPVTALQSPNSVVITQSIASKYFGLEDPVNKIIQIGENEFKVTGIAKDVTFNSHFDFNFLVALETFEWSKSTRWFNNSFATYIILNEGFDYKKLQEKLPAFVTKHLYDDNEDHNRWEYFLQPLTSIHLNSNLKGEFKANGSAAYVYIFSAIAFFVLIIACINFMNLTTAKSAKRAKEVGLRKVVGSVKSQLVRQFLSESIFLSFAALLFAILLVECFLPYFRNLIGEQLKLNYFENSYVLPGLIGLALLVGIVSGSYPAFYLSSFKPVSVLKGQLQEGMKDSNLRNGLVMFQFMISIILIISTIIVYNQMQYIQNKELGFDKEHVVVIKNTDLLGNNTEAFKEALTSYPAILNVSGSYTLPGRIFNNWGIKPEGLPGTTIDFCVCDENFLNTLKMEMVEGRFFSKDYQTDAQAIILNEETVEQFGWDKPIGKTFEMRRTTLTVIGVIKNFHYKSLHEKVFRMGLLPLRGVQNLSERYISARIRPDNIPSVIDKIKETWVSFSPQIPLDYSFLDDDYDRLYKHEQQVSKITSIFSFLAIFIASLGLFGLASFIAEQRTKEIGIRKVLGASVPGIIQMLSKKFLLLIFLANIIAWPSALFLMTKWLNNFAYKTSIGLSIFLFSGFLALFIAFISVGYQSMKAARANPVDSLRYE